MSSKLFRTKLFELSIFRKTGTYLIVLQYFVVAGANNAQRDSEMLGWYYKELGTFQLRIFARSILPKKKDYADILYSLRD
ncbi:hypothetical protein HZH66_013555 [Vespula vulgaris]|uniref:Uncharacterized protein n=1 Tax=Vespula vulgaris TaxID=7454 RepID=A0A834J578_VESVU|nr:hypothetical protein HZH66_013555 [Vespula vulgaris]